MFRRVPTILVLLFLASTAYAAEDCAETTEATLVTPATGVGLSGDEGTYYLVNDRCQPDCLFSVWIYEETNGRDGLQRPPDIIEDRCSWSDYDAIVL